MRLNVLNAKPVLNKVFQVNKGLTRCLRNDGAWNDLAGLLCIFITKPSVLTALTL